MAATDSGNGKKVAADFAKMIQEARDRKKNEALAAKIFGRSTSSKPSPASSLASRAGVKKQRSDLAVRPRHSTGSIETEWTHDLHDAVNPRRPAAANGKASGSGAGSLASRITRPGERPPAAPASQRQQRRAAQVARALIKSELEGHPRSAPSSPAAAAAAAPPAPRAMIASKASAAVPDHGFTIRGLAGPFVVLAQNFAPGTTAADIESAMTPVGGLISSCRIVKTHPLVIAEIVFESKEGAERVIETFNDRVADGHVLKVFHKPGNKPSAASVAPANAPTGPRAASAANETVVDGSYGFEDPMETDNAAAGGSGFFSNPPPTGPAADAKGGRLYSDSMVGRRGRGRKQQGR
ncbi:hypothetical protein VTJ83DRAFT_1280 [Remersonia thermophila]|uniref:RRM domain-containing protein n=1 Tax=Remersonia thermophila TaxID=72144 RepID=A0ABR4DP71_9PEZI